LIQHIFSNNFILPSFAMRSVLTFWSCLFLGAVTFGQIPERLKFNFYSVKDGLQHPIISSISQDRQGFLWITTSDGVCKFDGRSFK